MATDGTTGLRVNFNPYTYQKKEAECDDTPRPSGPSDPERRGSLQKISRLSAFSPMVLEEQLLALTNPLGIEMRGAR